MEKGVSHDLQINLDVVIPMACTDLHINVQDASGDRILAGDMLMRDPTNWLQWVDAKGALHALEKPGEMEAELEKDTHVRHVLGEVVGQKKKFRKTPKLRRGDPGGACRIYGSLEGNKVQGDFHITARGHGYFEWGEHLDHSGMSEEVAALSISLESQTLILNCEPSLLIPLSITLPLLILIIQRPSLTPIFFPHSVQFLPYH